MTRKDHLDSFSNLGFLVVYNPKEDGNCQFDALRCWLHRLGTHRSMESIRDEIEAFLTQHPNNIEGIPLEYFAAIPWNDYREAMARNGVYGDHITLQATADIFNIEILVLSSLCPEATTIISPTASIPIARIQLTHFAEGGW